MCRHITTTSRGELSGLERSENKVVLSLDLKAEMGGAVFLCHAVIDFTNVEQRLQRLCHLFV